MLSVFTRQIEKLGSEEGQALVFVAMVGLVVFLFFAMTMNVAELLNTKIKNQNVADATALSGAVWEARFLNLVAGTNESLLEFWLAFFANLVVMQGAGVCLLYCQENPPGDMFEFWTCTMCMVALIGELPVLFTMMEMDEKTGLLQSDLLNSFTMAFLEDELADVVGLNYSFKENTLSDDIGVFVYNPLQGLDGGLLRGYDPGTGVVGEYVFERAGICEIMIGIAYYMNILEHEYGVGLTDDVWQDLLTNIELEYADGGMCNDPSLNSTIAAAVGINKFPYMLRTRDNAGNPKDVEELLQIMVGIYKGKEPPVVLGKGEVSGECEPNPTGGDSSFPCPNARHYAFASAHAYSASVRDFYELALIKADGSPVNTPYPLPLVPFFMDWEARIFPIESEGGGAGTPGWDAYRDIAAQAEDLDYLTDNVLWLYGQAFFLY